MKRRLPKVSELTPLIQFKAPVWRSRDRRLGSANTIGDLRVAAKKRTPRAPFDYADGGADDEIALARARAAFRDVVFEPSVLHDVSTVDTSSLVLGRPVALPFGIAPTGFTRMMHTEGELAGVTAAAAAGIPFALSTMGTASIEDVADAGRRANPDARTWFQLYVWKDRARSAALIERAAAAGMEALILTVDVPVGGRRLRDIRNGMTVPPSLTPRTVVDTAMHPAWWFDFLTTEPLSFSSLERSSGSVKKLFETMFDPSVTIDDLEWIRSQWSGSIIVKGVQSVRDAGRIADAGVDAIVLSNHGGRQLDRAVTPFDLLPAVVDEFRTRSTRPEVWIDTGIMSGGDVLACIAAGADFTLIGRAYLYGLMAGGRPGVDRALDILGGEIERTMRLLGVARLSELTPEHLAHHDAATVHRTQLGRSPRRREPAAAAAARSAAHSNDG